VVVAVVTEEAVVVAVVDVVVEAVASLVVVVGVVAVVCGAVVVVVATGGVVVAVGVVAGDVAVFTDGPGDSPSFIHIATTSDSVTNTAISIAMRIAVFKPWDTAFTLFTNYSLSLYSTYKLALGLSEASIQGSYMDVDCLS